MSYTGDSDKSTMRQARMVSESTLKVPVWDDSYKCIAPVGRGKVLATLKTALSENRIAVVGNWLPPVSTDSTLVELVNELPGIERVLILVGQNVPFTFSRVYDRLLELENCEKRRLVDFRYCFDRGRKGDVTVVSYGRALTDLREFDLEISKLCPDVLVVCYDAHGPDGQGVALIRLLATEEVVCKVVYTSPVEMLSLPYSYRSGQSSVVPSVIRHMCDPIASMMNCVKYSSYSEANFTEVYYDDLTEPVILDLIREAYQVGRSDDKPKVRLLVVCKDPEQAMRLSQTVDRAVTGKDVFTLLGNSKCAYAIELHHYLLSATTWLLFVDHTFRCHFETNVTQVIDTAEVLSGSVFGWLRHRTATTSEQGVAKNLLSYYSSGDVADKSYIAQIGLHSHELPRAVKDEAIETMGSLGYMYGSDGLP